MSQPELAREFPSDADLSHLFDNATDWLRQNDAGHHLAHEQGERIDGIPVSEDEEFYTVDVPGANLAQLLGDDFDVLEIDEEQGISVEYGLEHFSRGDALDPERPHYRPDVLSFIIYKPQGHELEQENIVLMGTAGSIGSFSVFRDKIQQGGGLAALVEVESDLGFGPDGTFSREAYFEGLRKDRKASELPMQQFNVLLKIADNLDTLTRATSILTGQVEQEDGDRS